MPEFLGFKMVRYDGTNEYAYPEDLRQYLFEEEFQVTNLLYAPIEDEV